MSTRDLAKLIEELPADARSQVERLAEELRTSRRSERPEEKNSNGALEYYMSHPIRIEGFPPFDRDEIYRDRLGE
jgi:hypothetical protein